MRPETRTATCVAAALLEGLRADSGLDRFRPAERQRQALVGIASDPRGCVSAAWSERTLVGYAAVHPPSDIESWGADRTGRILELGAVEVGPVMRGAGLARRLLESTFADGRFDDTVTIATLYAWHYDVGRTQLGDFAYRRMLEDLYGRVGFLDYPTADPEVRSNAANALMARVPTSAPKDVVDEFHRLRSRARFHLASGSETAG